jgi:glycosyltransferase involved in cell wall biosynthesis
MSPSGLVVHQVLSGAGPVDAVTAQARGFRSLFSEWGWGGQDYAEHIDPRLNGGVRSLRALDPAPEDLVLLHYSAYAPKLRAVLGLPNPKVLLSHNVTPARWFWDFDPRTAVRCALGRRHLPSFVKGVQLAAAVSAFNAAELRQAGAAQTMVIPPLFDERDWGPPGADPDGPPTVLFVGRLTPHKRQDEVLRAFALYRRHRAPDARLVLVGEPLTRTYLAALGQLAHDLCGEGAVTIESSLSAEELAARYRAAHVFLCLSEHEGFCLPVLEALHFGVPVVARPVGGVPEVAGDAALLVEDDDLGVVAELVALAVTDAELRAELRRRGRRRLDHFSPERTARQLREAREAVAAAGAADH